MMRKFLSLLVVSTSLACFSFDALAFEKTVMYSCGTRAAGGSFYSDAGTVRCEDGPGGDKTTIGANDAQIFCMYSATCTAVTPDVRKAVLALHNERAFKKLEDWQDLTDDQMNQTVITAIQNRILPQIWTETSVQCMGTKFADGKPNCPGVNDCINNRRKHSALFMVKNYDKMVPVATDSQGFKLRKVGPNAPTGVAK